MGEGVAPADDNVVRFPQPDERRPRDDAGAEIRAFLIADVRGYTSFTQERGDEAAAELAAAFAAIVRDTLEGTDGRLLELRGDEALVVFASTRQAIRSAVALQERFVEETLADPELPLRVGIGIDAGEAVPVEGGYRGGALNLAARLCSQAGPGQVLASREATHLARRVDGVSYLEHGQIALKGLSEPVRVVRVVPESGDPATRLPEVAATPRAGRRSRLVLLAAAAATAVAVAIVAGVVVVGGSSGFPSGAQAVPEHSVGVLSTDTGALDGAVDVGDAPGGIALADGTVWVTQPAKGTLTRVSSENVAIVATIPVGHWPTGIAATDGAVWVTNTDDGTVSRVNPGSNTVVQTVRVGNGPVAVAAGAGAVWVVASLDARLVRLDARSGRVVARIRVGKSPTAVAVGDGSVWVANGGESSVTRVSTSTNRIVETVTVGRGPSAVAAAGGVVWVANALDDTVSRVDSASGVVTTSSVGSVPSALVAAGDAVWVANAGDATLGKLDPLSGATLGSVTLTGSPTVLAREGEQLATATTAVAGAHRGGVLQVVSEAPVGGIDPAAWDGNPNDALGLTHDGLLAPRHAGGSAGLALVPNLATSIPAPTNGGRTYTFVLRDGIRFSDGSPLRASDVRHSVARAFAISGWAAALLRVAGPTDCEPESGSCDLGSAVEADDAARTVTFHLAEPDPDFLYKLAGPWFWVVPDSAPMRRVTRALPGTGPYRYAKVELARSAEKPESRVVLERSPNFRVWSQAARPDGYPDRIVVRGGLSPEVAFAAVADNKADVLYSTIPPPDRRDELETTYTGRRHVLPSPMQWYFFLNTHLRPFDDANVRRAVAFALDRRIAAEALRFPSLVICQMLPPNYPGHEPSCPFTVNPVADGTWSGPELARAQQLVDRSGTKGDVVRLATWQGEQGPVTEILAATLRGLGYRVRVDVIPGDRFSGYYAAISDPESRIHGGPVNWAPDVPSPNGILGYLAACDAVVNPARFCEPKVERLIRRARRLQERNPAASNEIWAEVDRLVVAAAPYIPYATPAFVDLVSERVGNYQNNPLIGPLLDQMWVR